MDIAKNIPGPRTIERVRPIAMMVIAGVLYFAVIIVALHFLRPDLDPISRPTSEYAVGRYGYLMSTAFFSMSLAAFILVVGLYQGITLAARSLIGLVFLGLWGIGVLIAMIFPMDAEGALPTLSGMIHQVAAPFTFLSVTLGISLVSRRLKLDDQWRPFYRPALFLSPIVWLGFAGTFLSFITQSGFMGLAQRITLATIVTWMLLAAFRLRSVAARRS